ncbi:unnamed protein product [Trichobilharzia regenti]|nr:unnamed protein product [Trichobilharzia regenti]
MNKSAVLRRAIDRIRELEEINAQLKTELTVLRSSNHPSSYVDSNHGTSENEPYSFETSPVSLSHQEINDYYYYHHHNYQCKKSPQTVPTEYCIPPNQVYHFSATAAVAPTSAPVKSLHQSTNISQTTNTDKDVLLMKIKEHSEYSFHSSSSSSSSSSPPSINSPFNFQQNYDKKLISGGNTQYASVSPISNGAASSSSLVYQNNNNNTSSNNNVNLFDSYEIINSINNRENQQRFYHLSPQSLMPSGNNIQHCCKPTLTQPILQQQQQQQIFGIPPHPAVILPEPPAIIKNSCEHTGRRKRSAENSNIELFTPMKTSCNHLLVNNRDYRVKKLPIPQIKGEINNTLADSNNHNSTLATSNIRAQFPNVCQLLCENNSCPHPLSMPTKSNATDTNQYIPNGGVGFNEAVARTTLCVAALCLIAFNPAQVTNQMYWSTSNSGGEKSSSSSPSLPTSRSLLNYFDPSSGFMNLMNMSNSWLISFIYALQWFIALLLCSWACHRKHISFKWLDYFMKSKHRTVSILNARSHYRQANIAMNQVKKSIQLI